MEDEIFYRRLAELQAMTEQRQGSDVKRKQAFRIYGTRRHKELPDSGYPRLIFELAHQEAQGLNRSYTTTGDLLLGLLQMRVVTAFLKELGVDSDAVRTATEAAIEISTDLDDRGTLGGAFNEFNLTPRLLELHRMVWDENLGTVIGRLDEHGWAYEYLLVVIYEGKNTACQVLQSFGVDFERAKAAALKVFEEQAVVVGDYDA